MKVIWQKPAQAGRRNVSAYIRREFGSKREKKFRELVGQTVEMLMRSPAIGHLDPLLSGRVKPYRSVIINGLSKVVYYVENDTIYIAAFWDTRMEPVGRAAEVK